jgi:predicted P-loop ATPase
VASDKTRFHPVREYFDALVWDGVPRLNRLLSHYAGAEDQPPEYLARIGTTWMVAGVARVYNPGCKFDHMIVL